MDSLVTTKHPKLLSWFIVYFEQGYIPELAMELAKISMYEELKKGGSTK